MNSYRVSWTVDIDADSPEQAAIRAAEMQLDPASTATVFEVFGPDCPLEGLEVDLDPEAFYLAIERDLI